MTDAFIYDAVRTPRGKGRKDGSLHEVTPVRLAVTALLDGGTYYDESYQPLSVVSPPVPAGA